jgi:hypothetical protein
MIEGVDAAINVLLIVFDAIFAQRVDRRENRVSSGWEDQTRTFR